MTAVASLGVPESLPGSPYAHMGVDLPGSPYAHMVVDLSGSPYAPAAGPQPTPLWGHNHLVVAPSVVGHNRERDCGPRVSVTKSRFVAAPSWLRVSDG